MNNNRSGTSELHMSVRKFRAKIHEAYKAGRAGGVNEGAGGLDDAQLAEIDNKRREYVNEVVKDLNWR
jgi:hypothetical protein